MTRLLPMPAGLLPEAKPKRTARQRATAKGARVEVLARRVFEGMGCLVETEPKVLRMVKEPGRAELVPRTRRHDLFSLWDAIAVYPVGSSQAGRVCFIQVTSQGELSHKRRKILASDWPPSQEHKDDLILVYAGRGIFRVWAGPEYQHELATFRVPPEPKREGQRERN
jgi:hypothetical protein